MDDEDLEVSEWPVARVRGAKQVQLYIIQENLTLPVTRAP